MTYARVIHRQSRSMNDIDLNELAPPKESVHQPRIALSIASFIIIRGRRVSTTATGMHMKDSERIALNGHPLPVPFIRIGIRHNPVGPWSAVQSEARFSSRRAIG